MLGNGFRLCTALPSGCSREVDFEQLFEDVRREVTAVTADLRQAPDLLGDLPEDPLAQAWEQILAAVLAAGPPEDPFDPLSDPPKAPRSDPLHVLRVAGAEVPAGDLDGSAAAIALAAVDLTSAVVSDADVVAAIAAASRLAAWADANRTEIQGARQKFDAKAKRKAASERESAARP